MFVKSISFSILLIAGIFLGLIFIPRHYSVPELKKRETTQFWNLSTGSRIAYTLIPGKGKKKDYPVIFLQGGPGGPINDWNIMTFAPLAEEGYDVYLYDQIGCGLSARLTNINDYTVERHKRDLEEIVKLLGVHKVILVGQSWGAMLSALFIADNPEKVAQAVFTGPGPLLPENNKLEKIHPPDSLHLKNPEFTNRQVKKKVYTLRGRFVEFCAERFNWKLASDKEMDNFYCVLNDEMAKSTVKTPSVLNKPESGSGYYCMLKTVQSFPAVPDTRPKLANCKIPVLIMRGQYDGIKWGYVTEYLKLFSNSKLIIVQNAGHSIAREQPDIYIQTIREFLK